MSNSCNDNSGFVTENIDSTDVPVYSQPELPEKAYLPIFVEMKSPTCVGTELNLFNLPLDRVTPGGTFQTNTYSLTGNGAVITVPDKQVVPAFVGSTLPHLLTQADASAAVTKARVLILGVDPNDSTRYIVQASGFYSFPVNHAYIIGYQYYLSDTTGQVSTTPGTINQPLFYVVDQKTIQINLGV